MFSFQNESFFALHLSPAAILLGKQIEPKNESFPFNYLPTFSHFHKKSNNKKGWKVGWSMIVAANKYNLSYQELATLKQD